MPVLTQPPSMGDLLKYEANPDYCRETVTLLAGTDYPLGAVLGKITASGKYKLSPDTGTDGSPRISGKSGQVGACASSTARGAFRCWWTTARPGRGGHPTR